MFRRLETHGLPDAPGERLLFWDFRAVEDPSLPTEPGDPIPTRWHLSLQAWASGRWRRPEQAAWLEAMGLAVPPPGGSVALAPPDLARLTEALAPVSVVAWAAMDARDDTLHLLRTGQGARGGSCARPGGFWPMTAS